METWEDLHNNGPPQRNKDSAVQRGDKAHTDMHMYITCTCMCMHGTLYFICTMSLNGAYKWTSLTAAQCNKTLKPLASYTVSLYTEDSQTDSHTHRCHKHSLVPRLHALLISLFKKSWGVEPGYHKYTHPQLTHSYTPHTHYTHTHTHTHTHYTHTHTHTHTLHTHTHTHTHTPRY